MNDKRTEFSEFSAEEQRAAIAHHAQVTASLEKKQNLEKSAAKGRAAAAAKSVLEEFISRTGLANISALLSSELTAYLQESQAALNEAETALRDSNLQLQHEPPAYKALKRYCDKYRATPVVYDDIEWGEALKAGIYAFDELLKRELKETRALLSQSQPALLKDPQLRRIDLYFSEDGGFGDTVHENADQLRHYRTQLATLRAKAQE